jgi:hypothetical protein
MNSNSKGVFDFELDLLINPRVSDRNKSTQIGDGVFISVRDPNGNLKYQNGHYQVEIHQKDKGK